MNKPSAPGYRDVETTASDSTVTNQSHCHWWKEDKEIDIWTSTCGTQFYFVNGEGPKANKYKYCFTCGRRLEEVE